MTFPTPEQVRVDFEKSLQPISELFREEIRRLFSTPANHNGGWYFDPITLLAERFGSIPDFASWRSAFNIVKSELVMSGWSASLRTYRDEYSISIEPL